MVGFAFADFWVVVVFFAAVLAVLLAVLLAVALAVLPAVFFAVVFAVLFVEAFFVVRFAADAFVFFAVVEDSAAFLPVVLS